MSLIRDRKELIDTIDREMCRLEQQKDMLEGKREGLIEDVSCRVLVILDALELR